MQQYTWKLEADSYVYRTNLLRGRLDSVVDMVLKAEPSEM